GTILRVRRGNRSPGIAGWARGPASGGTGGRSRRASGDDSAARTRHAARDAAGLRKTPRFHARAWSLRAGKVAPAPAATSRALARAERPETSADRRRQPHVPEKLAGQRSAAAPAGLNN